MMHADIVLDYAFGDAGKGKTVDFLARQRKPDWVVRFNGGAQAAHNVVDPDGRHHCFHQFGSALLAHPDTKTYLTRHVLFDPIMAREEQEALKELGVDARLWVHPDATVVTPWHVAMNRLREFLRTGRHGSCGMGVGEARGDRLRGDLYLPVEDMQDEPRMRNILENVQRVKAFDALELLEQHSMNHAVITELEPMFKLLLEPSPAHVNNVVRMYQWTMENTFFVVSNWTLEDADYIIFEGAQGVLLDEWVGFFPHTTWTDTTARNAYDVLAQFPEATSRLIGVLRGFGTRHGAGPFPSEDEETRSWAVKGEHNAKNDWQGTFRTGWFDVPLAQYAIRAAGKPDLLMLTCLDRMGKDAQMVTRYGIRMSVMDFDTDLEDWNPPSRELSEEDALEISRSMTRWLKGVRKRTSVQTNMGIADLIRETLGLQNGWDSYSPTHEKTYQRGEPF